MTMDRRVASAIDMMSASAAAAAKFLEKSREVGISPADQTYAMGMAAYEARDWDAAITFLRQSFDLEPREATAARLAMCGWRSKNLTLGEEWINRAISLNKSGTITAHVLGTNISYLALAAEIQIELGRVDAARKVAEEALALSPDVMAYRARSNVHMVSGAIGSAREDLKRAHDLAPPGWKEEIATELETLESLEQAGLVDSFTLPTGTTFALRPWPI